MELRLEERTISGLHESLINKLPPIALTDRILDVGCGTGAWLQRLSEAGFTNLHGIDQDTSQFRASAPSSTANIDSDELGVSGQFDLITAIEVIEHLENPGRLFFHVLKLLRSDGSLLITTPNIHSLSCRLRFLLTGRLKSFDDKGDPTHIYPVLLPALERVLSRYGLMIAEQWGYPEGPSLTSRRSTTVLTKALAGFLADPIPGDTLCLLIRRNTAAG